MLGPWCWLLAELPHSSHTAPLSPTVTRKPSSFLPYSIVAGIQKGRLLGDDPRHSSTYEISSCIIIVKTWLVKASHLVNPRVNVGCDYSRAWLLEDTTHWGATNVRVYHNVRKKPSHCMEDGMEEWTGASFRSCYYVLYKKKSKGWLYSSI